MLLALGFLFFRTSPLCTMMEGRERDIPASRYGRYVRGSPGRKPSARASLAWSLMHGNRDRDGNNQAAV